MAPDDLGLTNQAASPLLEEEETRTWSLFKALGCLYLTPKQKLRVITFTAISRFTDDLACLVSCMSLANVVINDAHAGLADVEAHQIGPNQQRSAISLAGLLDDVVDGGLGIVLIA